MDCLSQVRNRTITNTDGEETDKRATVVSERFLLPTITNTNREKIYNDEGILATFDTYYLLIHTAVYILNKVLEEVFYLSTYLQKICQNLVTVMYDRFAYF